MSDLIGLHGQPWSVWADRLGRDSPLSDTEDQLRINQRKEGDAMKLAKQDMAFYGLCPVRDEFYLVTCTYCKRVCTPQGLKNHLELRHSQEWTTCQPVESADNCPLPVAMAPVSSTVAAKPKVGKKAQHAAPAIVPTSLAYLLATPAAPLNKHRGNGKRLTGKPVSVNTSSGPASGKISTTLASALTGIPYDKIPSPQQPPPVQFSPLQPTLAARSPVSPLTTSSSGVLAPSPAITMTVAVDSSGNQTVQIHLPELGNGIMLADSPADPASGRINSGKKQRKNSKADGQKRMLPLKERELDLEKHCGVWIGDIHRACTRSLTCKAHSLTLRRNVQGRSRSFDDLLAEHRAAKELAMKQLGTASLPQSGAAQPVTKTPPAGAAQQAPKLGRPPLPKVPPAKKLLTSLLQQQQPVSELSVDLPSAADSTGQQLTTVGLVQRVVPLTPASTSLTFTPYHPKPLAVCSFGLRRNCVRHSDSISLVTSDRKWDVLRATLRSTFQRPTLGIAQKALGRSPITTGLQSLLRPSLTAQQPLPPSLHPREANSIELPNGLQLSIGVQPEGNAPSHHHRVRVKKGIVNGLMAGGRPHHLDQSSDDLMDLMDDFDGLVGEDGALTFLNQGTEGAASLSLMADLSAGNITFSEINQQSAGGATAGQRLLPSTATSNLLIQPDLGEPM